MVKTNATQTTAQLNNQTRKTAYKARLLLTSLALQGPGPKTTQHLEAQPLTLDDHSEVVPPLPIPNRTVKHLCADDSGCTSVKVGHRQALISKRPNTHRVGAFYFVLSIFQ